MSKLEDQVMLIAALRNFTGGMPLAYGSEQEFFLTSLNNMAIYLNDLQKGTLEEVCKAFIKKLETGKCKPGTIDEFKAGIDSLISAADFKMVCGCMAGSSELIKQRLSALKPVSRVAEGKKAEGCDPEAGRYIRETYSRLGFDKLAERLKAFPDGHGTGAVLASAREEVANYCRLYRVPLNEADTMPPFSLACVDAALAASYRLYREITGSTACLGEQWKSPREPF